MDTKEFLERHEAVLTGRHFAYTSKNEETGENNHGPAYVDMRVVAHFTHFLDHIGRRLWAGCLFNAITADFFVGPETLGRTIAGYMGVTATRPVVWCDMGEDDDGNKVASFNPKLNFGRLLEGKRVIIVDDLLTTGSSVLAVKKLVEEHGGTVVAIAVAARRTPDVTAEKLGVEHLIIDIDVEGFEVLSADECRDRGPCSKQVPMVLRPGHGHKWIESHPDYPSVEL